jgi:MFS family permease
LTPRTAPLAVLAAAFLFNLGQGVLRPSLPLYLHHAFGASYRMVTVIPTLFGAARWISRLPTAYLQERWGRTRVMALGLLVIAGSDVASVTAGHYGVFLGWRTLAGIGWALFGTVATTAVADRPGAERRGRAISALLMSESLGLLLGSAAGGSLYQNLGATSPFLFEAACMVLAALIVRAWPPAAARAAAVPARGARDWRRMARVVRVPGVLAMSVVGAALIAIQTGALVFLYPLYLAERGRLAAETVGRLVSLSVCGRLAGLWLGGRLADRADRAVVLALGLVGYGIVLASLPALGHAVALAAWSALIGAGAGFVAGLPTAIVADRVPPPERALAIGVLLASADAGMLIGPLLMGELADALDVSAPFLCGGAALGALAWWCRRHAAAGRGSRHDG